MQTRHVVAAAFVAANAIAATSAQARTVTITFDGGCDALESGNAYERSTDGAEGPISFTDPNLGVYGHCGDYILLGDDGWSGGSTLQSATGDAFDVLSLEITGDHSVVRILDSMDMDSTEAFYALERGEVERIDDFVLLEIVGRRPDGSMVRTEWAPDNPVRTSFAEFTGIEVMSFDMTTYWDANGSLERGEGGYWYGCSGYYFRCGEVGLDNLVIQFAPVPVPAAGALMAGLLGMLAAAGGLRRLSWGCPSAGRAGRS